MLGERPWSGLVHERKSRFLLRQAQDRVSTGSGQALRGLRNDRRGRGVSATWDVFSRSGRCVQFQGRCVQFFVGCVQFPGQCVHFLARCVHFGGRGVQFSAVRAGRKWGTEGRPDALSFGKLRTGFGKLRTGLRGRRDDGDVSTLSGRCVHFSAECVQFLPKCVHFGAGCVNHVSEHV